MDVLDARDARWGEAHEEIHRPDREQQANGAAGGSEHDAFGEHLPHETASSGPHRAPDRQLSRPRGGANQNQARYVCAGDDQHARDSGEQDEQRRPGGPDDFVVERRDRERQPVIGVGVLQRERIAQPGRIEPGCAQRNPGPQARHDGQDAILAIRGRRNAGIRRLRA